MVNRQIKYAQQLAQLRKSKGGITQNKTPITSQPSPINRGSIISDMERYNSRKIVAPKKRIMPIPKKIDFKTGGGGQGSAYGNFARNINV